MASQKSPPETTSTDADDATVKVRGGDRCFRSRGKGSLIGKVHTSKGLRARRLRLSAPTAIKFYDLQDRLGYDRSTEAIDWLIQNAKSAIDALSQASTSGKELKTQIPRHILGLNSSIDFSSQSFIFPSVSNSHAASSSSTHFQNLAFDQNPSRKVNFSASSPMIFNTPPTENASLSSSNVGNGFPSFPIWE